MRTSLSKTFLAAAMVAVAGCYPEGPGFDGGSGSNGLNGGSAGGGGGGSTGQTQARACGYIEVTRQACRTSSFVHEYADTSRCHDGWTEQECRAGRPSKADYQDSNCYENYAYDDHAFVGTCEQWRQYFAEEKDAQGNLVIECLWDTQCPQTAQGRCVSNRCVCDGPCPKPMPPPPGPM